MPPFTVKLLGKKGRFANQVLQYAHLRQRGRHNPDGYCCPPWVGQELFGLKDPPPVSGAVDIGYKFPLDSAWYDKELFRGLFKPVTPPENVVDHYQRFENRTVIGLRLRRGDYGTFRRKSARWAFVAPTYWYLDWLEQNFHRLNNTILFIASDEPDKVVGDFKHYDVCCRPCGPSIAPDYADFWLLSQCDVLLISNSTFSFAASMLNERATEFWRPRLSEKRLIPYDPWNAPLVFME